tara:strand:+ start:72 stop:461 length:390 start_codon:yes stop_codon:yes gene_type:complete
LIYLDTSVVLAQLLAEDKKPPQWLWDETLISSRLLEYEVWTRVNVRGLADSHGEAARELVARIALLELSPPVLERVLEPFHAPVRTLDAIHLASIDFLIQRRQHVGLATYDHRMLSVAEGMMIETIYLG